ncbi:MAG: xanthine dehydrogenase family protein subunit M [Desulfovibrio sp.]|jgi:xanthine dehydrogenase YagS FAD-binding subunit|nr:xanthine dehydrogenase family protein subunit M [Desulfovibrio sp.]
MATVRDGMPHFDLYQPDSVEDALALLDRLGRGAHMDDGTDGPLRAWVLAGGLDCLERFKDRIRRPSAVVDLARVGALRGVRREGDETVIGPMTTLAEVARHPDIRERFGLLAEAAAQVASPQIRNQGTLGGNLSQDARCWYYRGGWPCYRAGGNICYAAAPGAMNREHAVFGARRCVAVSPSDTAPALVALEARLVIRNAARTRMVAAEDYFLGPETDITRLTVLEPDDLLVEIRIPPTWAGTRFHFEKVRDRPVWDFALASIAAAMRQTGDRIDQARLVLGSVAARPWRLPQVEAALAGRPREEAADAADLAVRGAVPLAHNGYKVTLARNLARRAILGQPPGAPSLAMGASGLMGAPDPSPARQTGKEAS